MATAAGALKRFILWDYPRAVWQYDVVVGIILLFIFLTPREWFRDQPKPSSIVMVPSGRGTNVFWMEPAQLASVPDASRLERAAALLRTKTGRNQKVVRIEPIFDSEKDIKGYMAFTTP